MTERSTPGRNAGDQVPPRNDVLYPMTGEPPNCILDDDGEHVWWFHDCSTALGGHRVHTMLPLGGEGWTLVSREPLTVSPSIYCVPPEGCGTHGFFREGVWVGA